MPRLGGTCDGWGMGPRSILIVYYPVFMVGVDGAKDGRFPPIAVRMGNVLVVAWGWWLLRRVVRT
jgi:lipopolysaccharide export system permease protein